MGALPVQFRKFFMFLGIELPVSPVKGWRRGNSFRFREVKQMGILCVKRAL